jgi:plasmid stabilization system protein ParE
MKLVWSYRALSDLDRVRGFLAPVNRHAAARAVASIRAGILPLKSQPRLGQIVGTISGSEVRHILVGNYDIRYVLAGEEIRIVQIWHVREDR